VVRLALLSATMKLFFKRPAEVQAMLGKLLQIEISGEVNLLTEPHDRALLYYRMLQKGIDVARKVIESSSEYAGGLVDDDAKKQMVLVPFYFFFFKNKKIFFILACLVG